MSLFGFSDSNKRTAVSDLTLDIDGTRLPVALRRNARARRIILRLDKTGTGVVLTLPPGSSEAEALRFAEKQAGWIRKRLGARPSLVPFDDGWEIPVRDQAHVITHRPNARGTVWVESNDAEPPKLCVAGDSAHIVRRTKDWLKREARAELKARCANYAMVMGLTYKRIDLRDQTTRWGSCSSTGVLSFSWRLIFAPIEVLDYVAAHEVAHLEEMNHSPKFWALVEEALPTMQTSRRWLKQHGAGLHRYGPVKQS